MNWKHVVVGCVALVGCTEGGARPRAGYEREVRGGALHAAPIEGITVDTVRMAEVARSAAPLQPILAGVDPDDLDATATTTAASGVALTTVFARQQVEGVPIHGAYLYLATRPGPDGARALVGSSYHLYQGASLDPIPRLTDEAAVAAARAALRMAADAPIRSHRLEAWPLDGQLTLVWNVVVEGATERALVIAGGPRVGRVEVVDDRVYETHGTVDGWVAVGGAPGGRGVGKRVPLTDLTVEAGSVAATTGPRGGYQLTAASGATIAASPRGLAARVADGNGLVVKVSAPAATKVDLTLGVATGEKDLAHLTAFHEITAMRRFLLGNGFAADQLGGPVEVRVNLPDTCNAYYVPGERSLNFLRAGGGCYNSAERTIIAHEYGHFVDDTFGGITEGGLSEGWGDLLACLATGQPVIGGDLFADGSIIRRCDNDYQFPASGQDEVHELGQAWAGFGWRLRAGLIAKLGADGGELARALLLPSLVTNAPDVPSAVREVVLRDDDDGDLGNHTPHWDVILAAAEHHGLGFVIDMDLSAPAAVTDLAVVTASSTAIKLRWTAPGDDGTSGVAARYDLRWSSTPITEGNFAAATALAAPPPTKAGSTQHTTVVVPPVGRIYLALKAIDELNNTGALSNLLTVDRAPPTEVFADGAEAGLGGWEASGLWHVSKAYAASGAAGFWYGQEASGNYDTGKRTMGSLTSPVIDLTGVNQPRLLWSERLDVENSPTYDQLTVEVFDADDPTVTVVTSKLTGWTSGFSPRLIDLAGLGGRKIRVRFRFDSVDSTNNATTGWAIDDVRVIADPPSTPPAAGALIINEVLVDPPAGYDANGDGAWSVRDDEFVELVNVGAGPLDLGGVTVADSVTVRATFAPGTTLAPGQALVLFGGAAPNRPGVVTVGSVGLFLNNEGDALHVRRPDGAVLAERAWGREGGRDQSLTRQVDGDPRSPMVLHGTVASAPASPGTRASGAPFGMAPPTAARLVINEVLADPPVGYDADGDGVASVTADELVELVNVGGATLDLGGGSISDGTRVRGVFAAGTVLPPGGVLVVFGGGGGSIAGVPTVSFGPLQLDNGGDTVTVRTASGATLDTMSYGAEGGQDQSLVRAVDGDPAAAWVGHRTLSAMVASPGRRTSGQAW